MDHPCCTGSSQLLLQFIIAGCAVMATASTVASVKVSKSTVSDRKECQGNLYVYIYDPPHFQQQIPEDETLAKKTYIYIYIYIYIQMWWMLSAR